MTSVAPILTIAIPTYHRAAQLQAQLERLVPQLTPEVRLCVYDNASPDDTAAVVEKFSARGVAYHRAVTNCGGGRNFFRGFEECRTEWLWMLCDDDPVTATAVADLLAVLRGQTCDVIHLSSHESVHDRDEIISDSGRLLARTSFSALLWISTAVYRIQSIVPLFGLYNNSLSSCAPNVVMILALLEAHGGRVLLSRQTLLVPPACRAVSAWSALDCIVRMSMAPEYLPGRSSQALLAGKLLREWYNTQMLFGLRETADVEGIRKWQRISRQAWKNLKAYRARGNVDYLWHNWFRRNRRWSSLGLARQMLQLELLTWCPVRWFHALAGWLSLADDVRENYDRRKEHQPYG